MNPMDHGSEAHECNDVDLVSAPVLEELVHIAKFKPHQLVEFIADSAVEPVPVEDRAFGVEEDLIVGGQVDCPVEHFPLVQWHIQGEEIPEPEPEIGFYPALFKTVPVLEVDSSCPLPRDKLLENAVLVYGHLFILGACVIFTQDIAVPEQEVIIIFGKVHPDARPEQELFQVADGVVIPVLHLVVPVPLRADLLVSEIDQPVAQVTGLPG